MCVKCNSPQEISITSQMLKQPLTVYLCTHMHSFLPMVMIFVCVPAKTKINSSTLSKLIDCIILNCRKKCIANMKIPQ